MCVCRGLLSGSEAAFVPFAFPAYPTCVDQCTLRVTRAKMTAPKIADGDDGVGSRYDRQMRIWGAHGQRRLGDAHVLCLGSTAVSTETLKNIVLPGIGKVTIVDDALVTAVDLGNNFFLGGGKTTIGAPRATAVAEFLQELNPHAKVQGVHLAGPGGWKQFFENGPSSIPTDISLVVAAWEISLDAVGKAIARLQEASTSTAKPIPCVRCLSLGMLGMVRLSFLGGRTDEAKANTHVVLDSKDDSQFQLVHQLRLQKPFPSLRKFYEDHKDFDALGSMEHAHLPWVLIALKAAEIFGLGTRTVLQEWLKPGKSSRFKLCLHVSGRFYVGSS